MGAARSVRATREKRSACDSVAVLTQQVGQSVKRPLGVVRPVLTRELAVGQNETSASRVPTSDVERRGADGYEARM